jgi:tetratricopeptide (TPR) repeat protein
LSYAQKKDPDPFDRVITELQAGRIEQSLAALDEAIKQNPNNADAYLFRGSLRMQSDPAQALNDFNKVIELRPDSGPAYNQRAMMRAMNNHLAGALKPIV